MPEKYAAEGLSRLSPFSFTCGRCSSCCKNKKIQVNPYEILRMADSLNLSSTDFIDAHTEKGVYLKRCDDRTCIFLGENGCDIHPHRPLVCRLYPLGRNVTLNGEETFKVVKLPPYCQGKIGSDGTIESYIKSAELLPFMQAADAYLKLFAKLALALRESVSSEEAEELPVSVYGSPGVDLQEDFPGLLDMDSALRRQGADRNSLPADPYEKMILHIQLIEEWLEHPT